MMFTMGAMLTIPATNTDDANGAGAGYGMGIFRITADGVACWGHDGAWGTFAFHCPALDLTVAASSNTGDIDLDERAFLTRVVRLVRAAGAGPDTVSGGSAAVLHDAGRVADARRLRRPMWRVWPQA